MTTLQTDLLFEPSKRLLDALPGRFKKVDLHDIADPKDPGPDLLWLEVVEGNPLQLGTLIMVCHAHDDVWMVSHETANTVGGWPTHWDSAGTVDHVVKETLEYLK